MFGHPVLVHLVSLVSLVPLGLLVSPHWRSIWDLAWEAILHIVRLLEVPEIPDNPVIQDNLVAWEHLVCACRTRGSREPGELQLILLNENIGKYIHQEDSGNSLTYLIVYIIKYKKVKCHSTDK
jgi:hypothetical protein